MTQTPVTVTYPLEQVLGRIEQKLDNLQKDVNDFKTETKVALESVKGEIKALDADIKGISKRLENQEFINRGVLIGLTVALSNWLKPNNATQQCDRAKAQQRHTTGIYYEMLSYHKFGSIL